jgi:hypothetical protein
MKEFKNKLRKFLPKLRDAKERSLNEADTRMRIRLLLSEVLGYDLLEEITQEHMVQGHYVDLTVKNKGKIIFFIEAKSADTTLRDTHAYQATNYAATGGVNLCVLTNGTDYRLYYLTWDKAKIETNMVLAFNLLDEDINTVAGKIYLLSKESFRKGHIDKYIAEATSLGDKNLAQAVLSDRVLNAIRLELKNITGHNVKNEAIEKSIGKLFSTELYDMAKSCIKKEQAKKEKKRSAITPATNETPGQQHQAEESSAELVGRGVLESGGTES